MTIYINTNEEMKEMDEKRSEKEEQSWDRLLAALEVQND